MTEVIEDLPTGMTLNEQVTESEVPAAVAVTLTSCPLAPFHE